MSNSASIPENKDDDSIDALIEGMANDDLVELSDGIASAHTSGDISSSVDAEKKEKSKGRSNYAKNWLPIEHDALLKVVQELNVKYQAAGENDKVWENVADKLVSRCFSVRKGSAIANHFKEMISAIRRVLSAISMLKDNDGNPLAVPPVKGIPNYRDEMKAFVDLFYNPYFTSKVTGVDNGSPKWWDFKTVYNYITFVLDSDIEGGSIAQTPAAIKATVNQHKNKYEDEQRARTDVVRARREAEQKEKDIRDDQTNQFIEMEKQKLLTLNSISDTIRLSFTTPSSTAITSVSSEARLTEVEGKLSVVTDEVKNISSSVNEIKGMLQTIFNTITNK